MGILGLLSTVYNTLGTDICGSLLKICIPLNNIVASEIAIDFVHTERWIHLAEVTFLAKKVGKQGVGSHGYQSYLLPVVTHGT